MRRMLIGSLAVLLCGCAASLADIRKTTPTQSGTFPAPPATLAACVQQNVERVLSPYQINQVASPDQKEYYITATRQADGVAKEPLIAFDLFLVAFDNGSLVELREGASDGHSLTRRVWPIVESCAQKTSGANSPSPSASPATPAPLTP